MAYTLGHQLCVLPLALSSKEAFRGPHPFYRRAFLPDAGWGEGKPFFEAAHLILLITHVGEGTLEIGGPLRNLAVASYELCFPSLSPIRPGRHCLGCSERRSHAREQHLPAAEATLSGSAILPELAGIVSRGGFGIARVSV